MISIVIITYNRSELLKRTLKSILNQSFSEFEIILIDDGSVDNTYDLTKTLDDSRIKYYNFGKIGNLSKLRNLGISKSEGEFIAFCDDDDLWIENKLQEQMELLKSWDFVCSNAVVIDKDDNVTKDKYFEGINKSFEVTHEYLISQGNCILTSSCVIKRAVFLDNNLLFDEKTFTNYCEDYELFIRLSRYSKTLFDDSNLILKRSHQSVGGGLDNNIIMLNNSIDILKAFKQKHKHVRSYQLKSIEGILGFKILLIKLSFKKSLPQGIRMLMKFVLYISNPVVLFVFFRTKLFRKISKLFKYAK